MRFPLLARFILAIAISALAVLPAGAFQIFSEPGWYQVADTGYGPFLHMGPFPTENACESVLPADDEDTDYVCAYFETQPEWDIQ